jgi:hypothetical protein
VQCKLVNELCVLLFLCVCARVCVLVCVMLFYIRKKRFGINEIYGIPLLLIRGYNVSCKYVITAHVKPLTA